VGFYRCTYRGVAVDGEEWNFTVHVQGAASNAAGVATIAGDAGTLLWNGAAPPADSITQLVPTGVILSDVLVDELDGLGKNLSQSSATLNHAGTNSSTELPMQCSVAVSLRTASPTRAGRGRSFLPPYGVDTVVDGKLIGLVRTQTAAAAQGWIQHFSDNAYPVVIYHRGRNSGDVVNAIDVGDVFDTQRRRRNQQTELRTRHAIT
jgi:hypothetical protein